MFRSQRLLNQARGRHCTIRIPGVCNGNPETVVAAHSNQLQHGKGMGIKAHDCYAAWACSSCHAEIDQGNKLSRQEKDEYWQAGFERTILQMFLLGIIVVG
jgi:ferredoxin